MRISNSRPTSNASSAKSSGGSRTSSSTFNVGSTQPSKSASPFSGVTKIANVGAIVSIQNIENNTAERANALTHGREMLNELDELKVGVLNGSLTKTKLKKLKRMAEKRPEFEDDKGLKSVLDHIELRAMVELAKLGLV